MLGLFGNKKIEALMPITGQLIPMEEVEDDVFGKKMMGDGFAVIPEADQVYSPFEGKIIKVFKTKHAILMETVNGLEIILHMGIGTVALKGEGFDIHVEEGDQVSQGTLLANMNLELIKQAGISVVTPVVITNMDKVKSLDLILGKNDSRTKACTIKLKG